MKEYREHIDSEFEKLHKFLKERQEKVLEKLHEEGESLLKEMEANVGKMQEGGDNIKEHITVAKERLDDTDSISFLTVSADAQISLDVGLLVVLESPLIIFFFSSFLQDIKTFIET